MIINFEMIGLEPTLFGKEKYLVIITPGGEMLDQKIIQRQFSEGYGSIISLNKALPTVNYCRAYQITPTKSRAESEIEKPDNISSENK